MVTYCTITYMVLLSIDIFVFLRVCVRVRECGRARMRRDRRTTYGKEIKSAVAGAYTIVTKTERIIPLFVVKH